MRTRVGLHPNFLPNSTQGTQPDEVIDFVCKLWLDAVCFRSHSFFDHTHITMAFKARGFLYDSNIGLFLQPNCVPLSHGSGLLRFPVFWQDDTHFDMGLPFDLEAIKPYLDTPGLKIFDVHPLLIGLNVPTRAFYLEHKVLYGTSQDNDLWRDYIHRGAGVRTLLLDILDYIAQKGYETMYLHDLYSRLNADSAVQFDVSRAS
jgi:hypothetical protein